MSLPQNPALPIPGGYSFQPVTPETISLLEGAGVPIRAVLEIQKKFRLKVARTSNLFSQGYQIAKTAKRTAQILNNPDNLQILVLVLTSSIASVRGKTRAMLLDEARIFIQQIGEEQFSQLSRMAGNHLVNVDFTDGGAR